MIAGSASLVLTVFVGQALLGELRRRFAKAADQDVAEVLTAYADKRGTPTMGGVIFLAGAFLPALAFGVLTDSRVLIPLLAMAAAAAMATFDDLQTLLGAERLSGHETWLWALKWLALLGIGVVVALLLYYQVGLDAVLVPHFGAFSLGLLYIPVSVGVFVAGTSGIVITDGMDGLMAGLAALAYAAYGTIALAQGQEGLAAFAFSVMGGAAGFLWFNAHPALVFMGEVGSQALAVGLVVLAFMTGWWLLLPVIGVVFLAEGLSDVVQIGSFKLRGKRVFRMAPVHYHFQLGGWTETQVVARFWLAGLVGAMLGIALALTG